MKKAPSSERSSASYSVAEHRSVTGNSECGMTIVNPIQTLINQSPRLATQGKFLVQLQSTGSQTGNLILLQRQGEEEEPRQGKHAAEVCVQREAEPARRPNSTGLPDHLKSGVESLSGLSLDDVKVHYNSDKPAQLNALAYTQGTDIHVAPGQERHLPHEAWHVVQQAQGRVQPTMQMKDRIPVNDDPGLEQEADAMGEKAYESGKANDQEGAASNRHLESIIQCKPANFYRSYELPMKFDKYDGFKGVRSPHIAENLNKLRADGVITTPSDFIGGHLLKAELGGADVADNVVPWCKSAEDKFGSYEATYKKRITDHYQWLSSTKSSKLDKEGNWVWPFYLNVQYEDVKPVDYFGMGMGWSGGEQEYICDQLSTIPASVMVNPGGTMDFFETHGKSIKGSIRVNPKASVPEAPVRPERKIDLDNIVDIFANRFEQNLKLYRSKGDELADEVSDTSWGLDFRLYWLESFIQSLDRIRQAVDVFPTERLPVEAPMKLLLTGAQFYTFSEESTRAWEHMRREVLENPVQVTRKTFFSSKYRVDNLIQRYESILKNTLYDFDHKLKEL